MSTSSVLPSGWKVPDVLRGRLGADAGRQRAMLEEGHLLIVLHAPPNPDDEERVGRIFWRKPDGAWASTTSGQGHNAIDAHLEEYDQFLDRLDDQEDAAQSANDYFQLMRQLNPFMRASRNLHAALQQAREFTPNDRRIIDYRDRAYGIERRAELLMGDAQLALDNAVARQSEAQAAAGRQMAIASHRLNLLAAFFFPIATLTAIFGMNVKTGVEPDALNSLWPFFAILGVGLLAGAVLMGFVTTRRK